MILVNTTFAVDNDRIKDFRLWVADTLVPLSRCEVGGRVHLLSRVLNTDEVAQKGCQSYALQFRVTDIERAQAWVSLFESRLMADAALRWGAQVLPFTTLLDILPL